MNYFYRAGIAFCMGWVLADGNYFGFALIGLCWIGVEQAERRLSKANGDKDE